MCCKQVDIQHNKPHQYDDVVVPATGCHDEVIERVHDGIDLTEFYQNAEFDIIAAPAEKRSICYAGSKEAFPMWRFYIVIRRKFLFYTVNLIIPLISHAFITILVFYIPANSHQKMSLSINVLLSLTVFFLMLAEIIPQNSLVVPLLTQYLVFTMALVAASVILTAITYNIHFRSSSTHVMPDWTRKVCGYIHYNTLKFAVKIKPTKGGDCDALQLEGRPIAPVVLHFFAILCCTCAETAHVLPSVRSKF